MLRTNDRYVRATVVALLGPAADAVIIEAYVRAYRSLPLATDVPARTWLLQSAIARCDDEQRRRSRQRTRDRGERGGDIGPPEPPAIPPTLNRDQRTVLALVDAAGLTPREAAHVLSSDPAAVVHALDDARAAFHATVTSTVDTDHPATATETNDLPSRLAEILSAEPPIASDDFWVELGQALLHARATPATGSLSQRPSTSSTPTQGPIRQGPESSVARHQRVEALRAAQRSQHEPRQPIWKALALPAAIAIAAIAAVAAAAWMVGKATHRDAKLGTTAAKVLAKVDHSLAIDDTISAELTYTTAGQPSQMKLLRASNGSYRITRTSPAADEAWDAAALRFTRVADGVDGQPPVLVDLTGVAPGGPEVPAAMGAGIGDPLTGALHLMHLASGVNVSTETRGDRTVWVVEGRLTRDVTADAPVVVPGIGSSGSGRRGDSVRIVIDQSLVLPEEFQLRRDNATVIDVEFGTYTVGNPLPPQAFTAPIPSEASPTANVTRADLGYAPSGLEKARADLPTLTLTPGFTPEAFTLSLVSSRLGDNPALVLVYRNGSRQIAMSVRPHSDGAALSPWGTRDGWRRYDIGSGRLSGSHAWSPPEGPPHLVAESADLTVTADGDAPRGELLDVVRSLR